MNLPFRVSPREKKFLLVGGIIVFLIIIFHLFSWYNSYMKGIKELSEAKLLMLEKQLNKLSEKDVLKKQIKAIKQDIKRQERFLLQGSKPPIAAAELQRILKEEASSLNIEIKLERTLNPVDTDFYLGIPVEIGFVTSTAKLKDFLYKLRASPLLLMISEMKIRVTNISNPVDIYTTLIVTGFTKKPR
jgi:Tfp pilus assembly protein PilO